MTPFQAELKYYLRSPLIWLVATVFAFVSAWSFLLLFDLYIQNQVKFAGMSDAPSVYEGIIFPAIQTQAKLMIVVVSILGGLSFARLYQNNAWSFVQHSQHSEIKIIINKFMAVFTVSILFLVPLFVASALLMFFANLPLLPLLIACLGLLMLLFWMLSLSLLISSLSQNSGFAILMSLILLIMLWMLSQTSLDATWGKSWIVSFSPQYHFKQFFSAYLSYASLFYFASGTMILLFACQIRIIQKRNLL
jgi:ABC-type transport system involved in multi-copper enzyme maturation permease subunit